MSEYRTKQALLGNAIDYAGTFPPASLSFEDAVREAATFRSKGAHPWLLSKIVFTMADLKKILPKLLFESGADGAPWVFAALGSPVKEGSGVEEFVRTVEWDLRELRHFNERGFNSSCRHWVSAYEMKLPGLSGIAADEFIQPILERFSNLSSVRLDPYFEFPLSADFHKTLEGLAEALAKWTHSNKSSGIHCGLKVRTGGVSVPTTEQLAEFVLACTTRGLRFKATQGLHHALSSTKEWGFLNLFSALAFAQTLGESSFGLKQVKKCLEETDAKQFSLGPKGLKWMEFELDTESIEVARRKHSASFGSCSIQEPDEALSSDFKD